MLGALVRGAFVLTVAMGVWVASSLVADVPLVLALLRLVVLVMVVAMLFVLYAVLEEVVWVWKARREEQRMMRDIGVTVVNGEARDLVRVTVGERAAAYWEAEGKLVYRTREGREWTIPKMGWVVSREVTGLEQKWCVGVGAVPGDDRMLAILLMLQTDEAGFQRVANRV